MGAGDVVDALQTIHGAVTGVTTAPTAMPAALNPGDLPMTLTYPGPAEHIELSFHHQGTERIYLVWLYVKPIGQGEGVDEGYQKCLPFLQRFRDAYAENREATANWKKLRLIADSGVELLTLRQAPTGELYWGIIFQVQITHYVDDVA